MSILISISLDQPAGQEQLFVAQSQLFYYLCSDNLTRDAQGVIVLKSLLFVNGRLPPLYDATTMGRDTLTIICSKPTVVTNGGASKSGLFGDEQWRDEENPSSSRVICYFKWTENVQYCFTLLSV